MPKKHSREEIISKLRQLDVLVTQGQSIVMAFKAISVSEQPVGRVPEPALVRDHRRCQAADRSLRRKYNESRSYIALGDRTPQEYTLWIGTSPRVKGSEAGQN